MKNIIHDAGGWKLRLRFKAGEVRKVSRCACDARGVPSGRVRQDFRKARELYRAGKITMDEALALAAKS